MSLLVPSSSLRLALSPTNSSLTSQCLILLHEDLKTNNDYRMLMQTPITIECGQDLSDKLTVHEELLCCHSRLLEQRFSAAKDMRQQYEQAKTLRDQMAAYVFPEVTKVQFEARSCEKRVYGQSNTLHSISAEIIPNIYFSPISTDIAC